MLICTILEGKQYSMTGAEQTFTISIAHGLLLYASFSCLYCLIICQINIDIQQFSLVITIIITVKQYKDKDILFRV